MTAGEKKIHELGSVTFCTEPIIERLRTRASKIDGDGLAYVSKDELLSIAERLELLNGYGKEYHEKLRAEREDLKVIAADPALTAIFGEPTI